MGQSASRFLRDFAFQAGLRFPQTRHKPQHHFIAVAGPLRGRIVLVAGISGVTVIATPLAR